MTRLHRWFEPYVDSEVPQPTSGLAVLTYPQRLVEGPELLSRTLVERKAVGGWIGVLHYARRTTGETSRKHDVVIGPRPWPVGTGQGDGRGNGWVPGAMGVQTAAYPALVGDTVSGEKGHDMPSRYRQAGVASGTG